MIKDVMVRLDGTPADDVRLAAVGQIAREGIDGVRIARIAMEAGVSPANAAIAHTTAQAASPLAANWPGTGSLLGAACLAAVAWGVSVTAATRRDTWSVSSS